MSASPPMPMPINTDANTPADSECAAGQNEGSQSPRASTGGGHSGREESIHQCPRGTVRQARGAHGDSTSAAALAGQSTIGEQCREMDDGTILSQEPGKDYDYNRERPRPNCASHSAVVAVFSCGADPALLA